VNEVGVVISKIGQPLFWHLPEGRTAGSLPDSRTLWQVLWDAFKADTLLGFAHSHPGSGVPGPSYSDVTTFAAVEAALGKRLDWWITSSDHVVVLRWGGPDKLSYRPTIVTEAPSWVAELRRLSQEGQGQ
jgi:hypothetical protein